MPRVRWRFRSPGPLGWQRGRRSVMPWAPRVHFIVAIFRQKFFRLPVTPNSVVKCVMSTSTMSPARCFAGGIHSRQLNSVFPAAVNGCGRSGSIGWRASTWIALLSLSVIS